MHLLAERHGWHSGRRRLRTRSRAATSSRDSLQPASSSQKAAAMSAKLASLSVLLLSRASLVTDLSTNQATPTPISSIRSSLFNVMAASRAFENIVSTEADRQAQVSIQLSCVSPSPCSGKDSLFITLTTCIEGSKECEEELALSPASSSLFLTKLLGARSSGMRFFPTLSSMAVCTETWSKAVRNRIVLG
jgi:hypothetical protein